MSLTLKKSILIYSLALLLELTILILVARHANWSLDPYLTGFDTVEYSTIAKNLVDYHAFSKSSIFPLIPNFFRSPGYPFWLAFIYVFFGSLKPAIFLGMIIFSLSALLTYLIAREVFSEKLAFLAGLIFALEPRMAFSAPFLLSEQIFMPLFLLSVFFAIRFLSIFEDSGINNFNKKNYVYLSAVFLSLSALVRGISFYIWPIFLGFFLIRIYKNWPVKEILKTLGLSTAIFILVFSPWLIRNKLTLGTWQSSSLFGVQLYWGHLETLERYLGVSQEISHQKNFDRAIKMAGDNLETSQAVNILTKAALSEIRQNWQAYVKVYILNIVFFLVTDGYKGIFSYIINLKPNYTNLNDFLIKLKFKEVMIKLKNFSPFELFVPILGRILWIVMTFFSFAGAILSLKNMPINRLSLILFLVLILYFAMLTGPVFSPDPRFRMPVNAFLISFALVFAFKIAKKDYKHE